MLAPELAGAYGELWENGSGVGVWVRDRLGERVQLGVHPSGFGTFLTLNQANQKLPYLGPVCGLEPGRAFCSGPFPCHHHELYELAMSTHGAGDELETLVAKVRSMQVAPYAIDERGTGTVSPEGYFTTLLRLDHDSYLVSTYMPEVFDRLQFSCLVDGGVCLTHTTLWKGVGCIGRFVASSPLAMSLAPHFSTGDSPALTATLNAFQLVLTYDASPRALTLRRYDIPADLNPEVGEPQLRASYDQLYLRAPGMSDVPLIGLSSGSCFLCPSGVLCAKHPGLAYFAKQLNALRPAAS